MTQAPKYTNALIDAQSPYLLQHAHNPVDWVEWSDHAWERARIEDKIVLVSIGYASCHWCHVMEHESFENPDTAAIMNEYFVCIKVDREERPDVDQVYMDAVQLMTGRGGWPLNMFCLPDGRPIHGGTYFPNQHWNQMLFQLHDLYQNRREEALEYAEKLLQGIRGMGAIPFENPSLPQIEALKSIVDTWSGQFDWKNGGNARTPKFPLPVNYSFLFHAGLLFPESEGLKMVELTLDKMASGGIYDQLAGGFARYSVDAYWKVPHFEKMLYDNGQLIGLYAEAAALFKKDRYRQIVQETIAFAETEWKSSEGLYFSSYDADSEGKEGTYYTWKMDELRRILNEQEFEWFTSYYTCEEKGNWEEDLNIIHATLLPEEFATLKGLNLKHFNEVIEVAKSKLLKVRETRMKPGLDDKCILSWNALYLKGLAKAARNLKEQNYLSSAVGLADAILHSFQSSGQWHRIVKDKKASIPAFLDDLCLLADALIELYQASFQEKYLHEAHQLIERIHENFYDQEDGLYYYTSHHAEELIVRKKDLQDDVIPSSNAIMALNYQRLYYYFGITEYRERYEHMLLQISGSFEKFAAWYTQWGEIYLNEAFGLYQLCGTGPGSTDQLATATLENIPNIIVAASETESDLPILRSRVKEELNWYLCYKESCFPPSRDLNEVLSNRA
ncbi:MAG: DUF255 domain-containing protein [Bacteroidetes bacterium]|nr:DUF255 domain-containing protein [Bacteroidota bacterium]